MSIKKEIETALTQCRALHANGNYQQAEALALGCITQSTEINDHALHFRSVTALGHVQRAQEQFGDALDTYAAALSLAKGNLDNEHIAKAWLNIGLLFLQGCVWDVAIECFERITNDVALSKAACLYKTFDNLAACHLHCNNIPQALAAMRHSQRLAPTNFCHADPYGYLFSRHTLVQLLMRNGDVTTQNELVAAAGEAKRCRELHPDNRSVSLLCDLIEGSVGIAYARTADEREASIALIYRAHETARYVNELMVDVLACLVHAEFMAGRVDRMRQHLEAWIARAYEDAGWQAAQKLGLHHRKHVRKVLAAQWPELDLGQRSIYASPGPTLPAGLMSMFSKWIKANQPHWDRKPMASRVKSTAEAALLAHLEQGRDNAKMAQAIGVSKHSARTMTARLCKSLGHGSRLDLTSELQVPKVSDYWCWLMDQNFDEAIDRWHNTPPRFRDSRVRLLICLMLHLMGRDDAARQESTYLLPADWRLFMLFSSWWSGREAALQPLLSLLKKSPEAQRYPVSLFIYFAGVAAKKYKLAADIACCIQAH